MDPAALRFIGRHLINKLAAFYILLKKIVSNRRYKGKYMLCERCGKNPATVSYMEEINGNKVGYNLCEKCYSEFFGSFNSSVDNDILAGLIGQSPRKRIRSCPVCGASYSDFERTGLLGCAACYDVFKEELMPYIERIQGKVVHVGKKGQNLHEQELTRSLSKLQEELERAVRERRYPDAERINTRIRAVRTKIKQIRGEKDE